MAQQKSDKKQDFDYAAKRRELEATVVALQSGDISIDQALLLYEKAGKLIKELQDYLATAENTLTPLHTS